MGSIKEYLISVISAAAICSVVIQIIGSKGAIGSVTKMIAGLFMVTVILQPVIQVKLSEFAFSADHIYQDAERIANEGSKIAEAQIAEIIITQTEAYILDKANTLELDISAEVILDGFLPAGVRLSGAASPYAKEQLSAYIEDTLGIPTEAQKWIGHQ